MECINCKKHGHTFRDCKEATSSYGVIAMRWKEIDGIRTRQYLLIRRRDSLGYVDFLRGKYTLSNKSYIETLLNQMTQEELVRLQTLPFSDLWTQLWNAQNTRQFRFEYENAKRMFETIRTTGDISGKSLSRYISDVTTRWEEPEWGFPKGRRSPHESELACAIREFGEETGISTKDLRILTGQPPEFEEYTGTNSIRYKHTYYLAECNTDAQINRDNRVQTREVGDIGWFSFEDAYLKIRETNPEKRAVLGCVHAKLTIS
jgi:8-oxo-dGTP pyrophosphatase MutT (NUDIX family)